MHAWGLHGVKLAVSDAHAGLKPALAPRLTGVPWQRCQFHLRRDFVSMIDRAAWGELVGTRLLHFSGSVFAWWQRHDPGSITRSTLCSDVAGLKPVVRMLPESGAACAVPGRLRSAADS